MGKFTNVPGSLDLPELILEENLDINNVNSLLEILHNKKQQLEDIGQLAQNMILKEFLSQVRQKKQEQLDQLTRDVEVLDEDCSCVEDHSVPNILDPGVGTSSSSLSQDGFNGSKNSGKSWLQTSVAARRKKVHQHFEDLEQCYFNTRKDAFSGEIDNGSGFEDFTESLSKFTRFSSFRPLATLCYASDIYNSSSIVSSIEFDRDCDVFAIAGVTKKIKVYEYGTVIKDAVDVHYPISEMTCNSKISCVTWSAYHKNMLASADYEGAITLWDAFTGSKTKIFQEHEKRCWSVDFNRMDPKLIASGSDDAKVKLWSTNTDNSIASLSANANVCCVKFNPESRYHLAFGSAVSSWTLVVYLQQNSFVWYQKMLQCCRCKQWYHEACMQCTEFPLMFGDSFYIFVCTSCNYGNEYIKRVDVEWQDLMHIALFNLVMENKKKKYFHVNRDIIPWLDLNLQALQIPKYENLNPEEKFQMTMEAFQSNNTRFSCAGENFKKTLQWGLRIRVPPPRIFITLPVTCKVSDDVMKKLKIKGRRSKVFIPMECKSPVLQIRHSPLHLNSSARKKLNDSLSIKVVGSNSPVKSQVASITRRKSNVKLPLLERLIPREPVFTDHLHPFKTEQELEQAQEEMNQRAEIWVSYQTMSASNSFDTVDTNQDLNADGPPILEKVEPISPSTSNSSTPPMPEINKKKGSRKSVQSEKDSKDSMLASRRKSRRVSLKESSPPNILDSQVSVKKVKTSGQNYFCAFDKTGYGKGFFIRGACARDNGEMQYLVDWDV